MKSLVSKVRQSKVIFRVLVGLCGLVCLMVLVGVVYYLRATEFVFHARNSSLHIASLYFSLGNYYFETSSARYNLNKATWYFEKALEHENFASFPIWYQIGRIHFIKGELAEAVDAFSRQIREDPSFVQSYYMRGLTYGYAYKYDEAEEDFKYYIASRPASWAAHNDLTWVYFLQGEYELAEATARNGLEIAPGNPWLSNALGAVLLNSGRSKESISYFETAYYGLSALSPTDWGTAYPGNNPQIYERGYAETLRVIEENLEKAKSKGG